MVALWAVVLAMLLTFIAGMKFALRRHIHFLNHTSIDFDVQVSPNRRIIIINEITKHQTTTKEH